MSVMELELDGNRPFDAVLREFLDARSMNELAEILRPVWWDQDTFWCTRCQDPNNIMIAPSAYKKTELVWACGMCGECATRGKLVRALSEDPRFVNEVLDFILRTAD